MFSRKLALRSVVISLAFEPVSPCRLAQQMDPAAHEPDSSDRHPQQLSRRICSQCGEVVAGKESARAFSGLDYRHQPLAEQFDSGVRQIELDVFADSKGGLYAHPAGEVDCGGASSADPEFDPDGMMDKPGFKVMHMQDIDYRSTCEPFTACLSKCGNGRMRIQSTSPSSSWLRQRREATWSGIR